MITHTEHHWFQERFYCFPFIYLCNTFESPHEAIFGPGTLFENKIGRSPIDYAVCLISRLKTFLWLQTRRSFMF